MQNELKPYPAYKDSGVPWLGQVPDNWTVQRLSASITDFVAGTWGSEPNGRDDTICVRVADFDRSRLRVRVDRPTIRAIAPADLRRKRLTRGDLLLEKSGGGDLQPVGVVMLFDHEEVAVCSNFVARMSVTTGFEPEFLTYLHTTLYSIGLNVRSIKQTTGIQNLDCRAYLSESVAFPPLPEQAAIVRYLDHADRKVRHGIRARQQLIKLLTEQKQAIIQRAVTRGLDPNVRLKPSGVPWLGDVPEHWEVRRLKTVSHMKSGESITDLAIDQVGEYPVYGGNGLRGYTSAYTHDGEYALIGRQGALCGNVHQAHGRFWASEHAVVASLRDGYGLSWFCSLIDVMNLNQYSMAAAQPGLAVEQIMNLWIPVPPADEQGQISDYLDGATANLDKAIDAARHEIDLLREHRTRLIADVVTGKLDVRDVPVPDDETDVLPEELESIDDVEATDESDDAAEGNSKSSTEENA